MVSTPGAAPSEQPRLFLSYSHRDVYLARRLETSLKSLGHNLWRDDRRYLPPGKWSRTIAQELLGSDIVLVIVSEQARNSPWVRSELLAAQGLGKRILPCFAVPPEQLAETAHLLGLSPAATRVDLSARPFGAGVEQLDSLVRQPEEIRPVERLDSGDSGVMVPFVRNPAFQGRDPELLELFLRLVCEPGDRGPYPVLEISGPAGVGKTSLAAEFALRFAPAFPGGIVWINGAGNLRQEFLTAAERLGLAALEPDSPDAEIQVLHGLKGYLTLSHAPLLVIENVAHPLDLNRELVPGFLPATLGCRMLVTTTGDSTLPGAVRLVCPGLPTEVALKLLLRDAPPASDDDLAAAQTLSQLVGNLPLGLELARGAYPRPEWRAVATRLASECPTPDTAFALLIRTSLNALSGQARLVLALASQMNTGEAIPRRRLGLFAGEPESAIDELVAKGLLRPLRDGKVRLHPTIREFTRSFLPSAVQTQAQIDAVGRLNRTYAELEQLEQELNQRGPGSVVQDLEVAGDWCVPDSADGEALLAKLELLRQELPSLRSGPAAPGLPDSYLQQIAYRAVRLGQPETAEAAAGLLAARHRPFLMPVPVRDPGPFHHSGWVLSVALSRDGRLALTGAHDKTAIIWDATTGKSLLRLYGVFGELSSVVFAPNGRQVLGGSYDSRVIMWDVATGGYVRKYKGHLDRVTALCLLPDGKHFVSGSSDGTIILWELDTGRWVSNFNGHAAEVNAVAVAPNGRWLLSGGADSALILWDVASAKIIRTMSNHKGTIHSIVFLPDSRHALSGAGDRKLILWDLETGQPVQELVAHADAIWSLAPSETGKYLLSGSEDRSVTIWKPDTLTPVLRLVTALPVLAVAWSGSRVVLGDNSERPTFLAIRNLL